VFVAAGVTALLLIGVSPVGVKSVTGYTLLPGGPDADLTLTVAVPVLFVLAAITLLKGKVWTGLFGLFVPPLYIAGAIRLARPGSPWARWRYRDRPGKLARADRREQRLRVPVIRVKSRIQDLLTGRHDQPMNLRERHAQPAISAERAGPPADRLDDMP
jgi:hypothetical protein